MKINQLYLLPLGLVITAASCGGPEESTSETPDKDVAVTTESSTCDCESAWFDASNMIVAPNEGPTGVFGGTSTTNCDFHQWSWQKFLYLTQTNSPEVQPYFLSQMFQVTSEMLPVPQVNGAIVLTEKTQAGGNGLLTTNPNFGTTGEMVYYSVHINDIFQTAADSFKTMVTNDPSTVNNKESFPVGALELKVSWVNTNAIPAGQLANYFTMPALINNEAATVALLGMHVVGIVENHPEFIWATFEHNDLSPLYDWAATSTSDIPVTSANNLLLFAQNATASLPDITWPYGNTVPKSPNNVFSVYQYGTPVVPGGGFMTTTSQTGQENFDNIQQINKSVFDTLQKRGIATIWLNYFYDGSIWMNTDGMTHEEQIAAILTRVNNFGSADSGGPLRGSMAASNISMETYEQLQSKSSIHGATVDSLMNCLVCHGPSSYLEIAGQKNAQSPTYISHIFMNFMNYSDPTAYPKGINIQEFRRQRIKKFEASRQK